MSGIVELVKGIWDNAGKILSAGKSVKKTGDKLKKVRLQNLADLDEIDITRW